MDVCRKDPTNLAARAKAEKYAKILSKTIINPDGRTSHKINIFMMQLRVCLPL